MADNVNIIVQDTINDIVVNAAVIVETIDINVQAAVDEVQIIANPNNYVVNINRIIGEQVQSDWDQADDQAPDYIKNKPTIPAAQVNSDWDATTGVAQILNKPTLATVATSGSYNDLINKPTIPTATSDLTNDGSDGINPFITAADIPPVTGFVPYTGATQDVDLGEFEIKAGQVEFDQTPTGTAGVGVMRWNDSDGTVDLGLKGGNVTLQIGQESVLRVVNKTATNVNLLEANYQAVRVTGAQGQRLKVDLALATTDPLSAETIGLVTETINNNQEGFITTSGLVRGINTTGSLQGETWADGDILYLSPTTAGRATKVKPTAPNHLIILGYVIHAHITQGSIFVKVDNGYEISELHDVKITTPANNNVLAYTSATDIWENKTVETALGFTPVTNARTISTTAPLSGGGDLTANRTLSITQSATAADGYLSSTDWNTFNGKQPALGYTAQNADLFTRLRNGWEASTDYISSAFNDGWVQRASGTGAGITTANFTSGSNKQGICIASTGSVLTGFAGPEFSQPNATVGFGIGNGELTFETLVMIPTLSTSAERFAIFSGILSTTNFNNPQHGVFFYYDEGGVLPNASPNWKCYTVNALSRTLTTTSIVVNANQWYKLKAIINAAGTSAAFYIDGTLVATHITNMPSLTIGYGFDTIIQKSAGLTARTMQIDYSAISQTFTTPR
jgi:hypothetical protein